MKKNINEVSSELILLAESDQSDIKKFFLKNDTSVFDDNERLALAHRCRARANSVNEIVTEHNVKKLDKEAIEATLTVIKHSYLELMKKILVILNNNLDSAQRNTHIESIMSLEDRISVLESRKQIYGTQWMVDENNKPFLIELYDFDKANLIRASYGVKNISLPLNVVSD